MKKSITGWNSFQFFWLAAIAFSVSVGEPVGKVLAQETTKPQEEGKVEEQAEDMENATKCPVTGATNMQGPSARHTAAGAYSNRDWWPNQLNLNILHQNSKMLHL